MLWCKYKHVWYWSSHLWDRLWSFNNLGKKKFCMLKLKTLLLIQSLYAHESVRTSSISKSIVWGPVFESCPQLMHFTDLDLTKKMEAYVWVYSIYVNIYYKTPVNTKGVTVITQQMDKFKGCCLTKQEEQNIKLLIRKDNLIWHVCSVSLSWWHYYVLRYSSTFAELYYIVYFIVFGGGVNYAFEREGNIVCSPG